jgi:hypothetical protein
MDLISYIFLGLIVAELVRLSVNATLEFDEKGVTITLWEKEKTPAEAGE